MTQILTFKDDKQIVVAVDRLHYYDCGGYIIKSKVQKFGNWSVVITGSHVETKDVKALLENVDADILHFEAVLKDLLPGDVVLVAVNHEFHRLIIVDSCGVIADNPAEIFKYYGEGSSLMFKLSQLSKASKANAALEAMTKVHGDGIDVIRIAL